MLINIYRNTLIVIKQWFASIYIAPTTELVKVRINKSETQQQLSARQRPKHNSKYRL